ncbi:hypothetical protein LIER_38735 [Lithospermum erythrorhizon]|uniref:Uncharacterized protein n=1 Tax=Lithospermum erythrorhizon TaxID=34254 RepID=A0AAV3Q428_LITER
MNSQLDMMEIDYFNCFDDFPKIKNSLDDLISRDKNDGFSISGGPLTPLNRKRVIQELKFPFFFEDLDWHKVKKQKIAEQAQIVSGRRYIRLKRSRFTCDELDDSDFEACNRKRLSKKSRD